MQIGDVISFSSVYIKPRWWQFWKRRPFRRKPPSLKLFKVISVVHDTAEIEDFNG
jgi:hypothetical protein